MEKFIAKFGDRTQGVLSGLDRVLFRGSLRRLTHSQGMKWYLAENNILCKQYQDHVKEISQELKKAILKPLQQQNVIVRHLFGKDDKEELARAIAAERGIVQGDVCAFTVQEMAPTFQHEKTDMVVRSRPCPTIYLYRIDPQLGWMHARVQTYFPFYMHVCINGREWLSRRMDQQRLRYARQKNCFPWIEDVRRAQQLFDEQLQTNWPELLDPWAERLNPLRKYVFQRYPVEYYWSSFQCEWATDVMFVPGTLERLEPLLMQHSMLSFSCADVLQWLGKRLNLDGNIPRTLSQQLQRSFKRRETGDRAKFVFSGNSIKLYGKAKTAAGDVLRTETLTQQVEIWKTLRPKEGGPKDDLQWRIMRRGVADMHRRCEISQKANERCLNSISTVDDSSRFHELTRTLEQACQYHGRRVRALRLFDPEDHKLLEAVNHGEFWLNGFRNRDIQRLLFGEGVEPASLSIQEKRRRSAAISRKLRILRAHGLIQKVQQTHRYQLTPYGRVAITAVLTIDRTSIALLNKAAA